MTKAQATLNRHKAKENGFRFYKGRPCGRCSNTKRRVSDKACGTCTNHPEKAESRRKSNLKIKYGMTSDQYDQMLHGQKGLCAICLECTPKRLAVDHDHKTGKVRGLLCKACNSAIGLFKDNIETMRNAIRYLKRIRQPFAP